MNESSVIQSQQAKYMEIILIWLGILIPLRLGPVVYQNLHISRSTPEFLINSLGALFLLSISLGFLFRYRIFPLWILKRSSWTSEASIRDSELSGWLTIGIFTFGLIFLVHTIPLVLYSIGDKASLWLSPNQEALIMISDKMWYYITTFGRDNVPQVTIALFLTIFPQSLAQWAISLQKRWGPMNTETSIS